jgi:glycosyltransferase involved in cell wall biosynthesis
MSAPRVSVVVAAHNEAGWLGETIASVRGQRFEDWELIVVDDGSTDGTADVVAQHASDPRVRCLRQARQERAAARNRGIAASRGCFVAFLDADDLWLPDKLGRQVAALDGDPAAGLCYTVARFIDAHGRLLWLRKPPHAIEGRIFPRLVRANHFILSSVLVRRSCLDEVGPFDTSLAVLGCEDWDLWLRLARRHPVVAVAHELTLYRQHVGNTRREQLMASALVVLDKLYADPQAVRQARISRSAARSYLYWYNAGAAARERRSAAVPLIVRALHESPLSALSRPAMGALASLLLPAAAARTLTRLGQPGARGLR